MQRRWITFWEALWTFKLFLMHFISFINNWKSKTIFKLSLNSHVFWDTLYLNSKLALSSKEGRRT